MQPSPFEWYQRQRQRPGFVDDSVQQNTMLRMQDLYRSLLEFKKKRQHPLSRLFGRPNIPRGLYLWGGVGRGKSFLMDGFYAAIPYRRKQRIHFHHFMQEVHQALKVLQKEPDPLATVAARIAKQYRLICFDEFHVSDIADAMILVRLLQVLFKLGVIFVMTSNYHPDDLYPDGLQRINFLPAIALIKQYMEVVNVDGGVDYRLRALEKTPIYHSPVISDTNVKLSQLFDDISEAADLPNKLVIQGRQLIACRHAPGVIWFEFSELCGGPRSQADYLEIAQEYHSVILSNLPKMSPAMASEARRFTWLVDIFYDHRVKLIISAEVRPEQLYTEGVNSHEFFRTISRLQEMQSTDYLGLAHISS